jgi:hypothetical protein
MSTGTSSWPSLLVRQLLWCSPPFSLHGARSIIRTRQVLAFLYSALLVFLQPVFLYQDGSAPVSIIQFAHVIDRPCLGFSCPSPLVSLHLQVLHCINVCTFRKPGIYPRDEGHVSLPQGITRWAVVRFGYHTSCIRVSHDELWCD